MSKVLECDNCHRIIRYGCTLYKIKRYANGNALFNDSQDFDICVSCLKEMTGETLINIMR